MIEHEWCCCCSVFLMIRRRTVATRTDTLLHYATRFPSPLTRYAELMTVFAVSVSGVFPILHLGRPWFFYWLAPYPNPMTLWPQWKSSLVWDFFAILAYLIVSILYWYVSLLPDLATLRDRARDRKSTRLNSSH